MHRAEVARQGHRRLFEQTGMLGIAPRTIYRHLERQQPEQEGASTVVAERAAFTPPTPANPDEIE
jgi:hypothetical protein